MENRLRWLGHVIRENLEAIKTVMELTLEGRRIRGRTKKWLNVIKSDIKTAGVCINDVEEQLSGRLRIKVADPK